MPPGNGPGQPADGDIRRCSATRSTDGAPCTKWGIRGTNPPVCRSHGGAAPQVRKKAMVKDELDHWGVSGELVDPGTQMLRLVAQSARRVEKYSTLLGQAYAEADALGDADAAGDTEAADAANDGLHRIMRTRGVYALVGKTYASDGAGGRVETGEAIRGLARLEAEERDRCARFAALAIQAGIAERQVRLAEQQAKLMAGFAVALARRLGLDPTAPEVRAAIAAEFRAIDAG